MLDIVYLSTIATAVYGLWFTLREMGAAFAVPYCLISWHALRMAKNPASLDGTGRYCRRSSAGGVDLFRSPGTVQFADGAEEYN